MIIRFLSYRIALILMTLSRVYLFIPFFPKISREKQGRNKDFLNLAWGRNKECTVVPRYDNDDYYDQYATV